VHVTLARGTDDPVSDLRVVARLADRDPNVDAVTHPDAGHDLPLSDPRWCVRQLTTS
jgi:pimeloyl-ACP methyl ester carboxylesterase